MAAALWKALIALGLVTVADAAVAEGHDSMTFDVTYLGSATVWCPLNKGIPVVVKIDGPDIVEVLKEAPKWVEETRGDQSRTNRALFSTKIDEKAETIGRFLGEVTACQSPWDTRWDGKWHVVDPSGAELGSGTYGEFSMFRFYFRPVERTYEYATRQSTHSEIKFMTLGDYSLFAKGEPEEIQKIAVETTHEEQSQ